MILKFANYTMLSEKYINLLSKEQIEKYSNEVYTMLYNSYKNIGGLKGNGFSSPTDMINNIKMIKLYKTDNIIKCCICYKDKDGRKMVALATDGTTEGKAQLIKILSEEFERSYFEVSDNLLNFIRKELPILFEKYKIKNTMNLKIFKDIIPVDEFFYNRKINNEYIKKIALGTPNKNF